MLTNPATTTTTTTTATTLRSIIYIYYLRLLFTYYLRFLFDWPNFQSYCKYLASVRYDTDTDFFPKKYRDLDT